MRTVSAGILAVVIFIGGALAADGTIGHERSKVLLLVHPDTSQARSGVQQVIERYRKEFEQESVLWETARVCAAA